MDTQSRAFIQSAAVMAMAHPWYGYNRDNLEHMMMRNSTPFIPPDFLYHMPRPALAQPTLSSNPKQLLDQNKNYRTSGSTTSSPISTISTEESHMPDCSATVISDNFDRYSSHSMLSPACTGGTVSPACSEAGSSAAADCPLDLSKPKQSSNKGKRNSHLENLLSRNRRKRSSPPSVQTDGELMPLNLSKRLCADPLKAAHGMSAVIDLHDAVDNPVELVTLAAVCRKQVSTQISSYLDQVLKKTFSMDLFKGLCENDQFSLLMCCWHRLLLWISAKNKFSFQVTSKSEQQNSFDTSGIFHANRTSSATMNQPSMAFVKSIACFISKYGNLDIDEEEFSLLFAITLFHGGADAVYEPKRIDQHRKQLMRRLQTYVQRNKPNGNKRYTDLLLYLPLLYGVNGHMVEKLLCSDNFSNTNIKVVIKEAVKASSCR